MRHKNSNAANAFVARSLVVLVMLLAGCEAPGEAEDTVGIQSIYVRLGPETLGRTPREAADEPPTFVIETSERDASLLGANGTTHSFKPERGFSVRVGTRFIKNYATLQRKARSW